MNNDLARNARSVDHLVLPVGRLDEARARLSLLGFTVAPKAQHPFGTANVCSFFADDTYLEMLAVDREPLYVAAARRSNSFILRDQAYRFRNGQDGFSGIAFKTDDARADHAAFKRRGVAGGRMVEFSRAFVSKEGKREIASFRLAFAADLRAPDAFFFTCQRLAYPKTDRSHLIAHENGVSGLRKILICEDNPAAFSELLQGVFHAPARKQNGGSLEITAGNADIDILPSKQFEQSFGWLPELHGRGLRLAGLVFTVASLLTIEQLLDRNGVTFLKRDGRIIVSPAKGQGTLFVFEGVE
ncbi:VOC family protein [Ochrobactrum soli]|uniref:VOC family protein n=1 Tax=Ochrobactrum soli TaxID=2448455 RepID=UPI000EF21483|nr:VOC family protein [[Ochrobactrum] soli]RLL76745.1 VOC family protein [[Ochrobactrum] soli]